MNEFQLKLPNAKTFDGLDYISEHHSDPAVRSLAIVVRDLADATIVLSKIIAASNSSITVTKNPDGIAGE